MKHYGPKKYVRIKFKPVDKPPRWYWARKLKPGMYKRVLPDGDECVKEKELPDGTSVCTSELLVGKPIEEKPARMNLMYAELEVVDVDD
jgi:hypothetical protein